MPMFLKNLFLRSLLLCLIVLAAFSAQAKIYEWTDSNGQKHFGQTPPPKQAGKKAPKVEVRKGNYRQIFGITKREGKLFCGNILLPQVDDPIIQLANANEKVIYWKKDAIRQQQKLLEYYNRQLKGNSQEDIIDYTKMRIDNLECALSWSKREVLRLQKSRKAFVSKLEKTREEFSDLKNRCGKQPDIKGWSTDKDAIKWAECKYRTSSIRQQNAKLRELKALEVKASILSRAEN